MDDGEVYWKRGVVGRSRLSSHKGIGCLAAAYTAVVACCREEREREREKERETENNQSIMIKLYTILTAPVHNGLYK